jgi:hypothetical protein
MADYGSITIRGARENNLKNVCLDIPKRRITVFTGVSGSESLRGVKQPKASGGPPTYPNALNCPPRSRSGSAAGSRG